MAEAKKKSALTSRIATRDDALATIKEASTGFFVVAALMAALSFFIGFTVLVDAALFAILGFFLRRFHSRVAAVLLLLLAVADAGATVANKLGYDAGGGSNIILAVIVLWAAIRAVEATFKLRSFAPPPQESAVPPVAFGPR